MADAAKPIKAKSRLFDLRTQAVGIVGRAANQRTWLVLKSQDGASVDDPKLTPEVKAEPPVLDPAAAPVADPAAPPAATGAGTLSMSSQMKTSLSALLASMLDTMAGIASTVESSTVDDTAPVPADVMMQLDVIADALDTGIDELMPAEDEAAELMPGETEETQKAAKPAAPASRQRRLIAQKRLKAMVELHKAIGEGHAMIGKGMSGLQKMMGELSGKAPAPGKDAPADAPKPEKTEKSIAIDAPDFVSALKSMKDELLASIPDEVKKSIGATMQPVLARLAAATLRAGTPLPRASSGDGAPPPAAEKPQSFQQMRDAALLKKN